MQSELIIIYRKADRRKHEARTERRILETATVLIIAVCKRNAASSHRVHRIMDGGYAPIRSFVFEVTRFLDIHISIYGAAVYIKNNNNTRIFSDFLCSSKLLSCPFDDANIDEDVKSIRMLMTKISDLEPPAGDLIMSFKAIG